MHVSTNRDHTMTEPAHLWRDARIATLAGDQGWGLIDNGAMLTRGGQIEWVGPLSELPPQLARQAVHEHSLAGALVTPGLIDCHTHLVYGGQRAGEFEQRLEGASYDEIARAGGGIRSTVVATRAADSDTLFALAARRARVLMAEGVTTLEIKSGYGLDLATELKMLRVARYLDAACAWLPQLHAHGLVDAVDAFCDDIGFTPAQTQRMFDAAKALGLPVKLHAEQLTNQHGAALAARHGALSCDHLEWLDEAGVQAMAKAGSVAVLLPGAYYFLRETRLPPLAALRQAGVPIAIASDHNPGSSPCLSLLLMINMACTLFRLTPEEAVRGVTVQAARALGLAASHGRLATGLAADFAVYDLEHPRELAYWFGHNPCRSVVRGGQLISPATSPQPPGSHT